MGEKKRGGVGRLGMKWCLCVESARLVAAFDYFIFFVTNTPVRVCVSMLRSKPTRRIIHDSLEILPMGFFDAPTALTFL